MKLPVMNVIKRKTDVVTGFTGLDMRPKTAGSAFAGMKNMTCERLPVMAARKPRMRVRTLRSPGGLFAHDKLCWVDGNGFYYDGELKGTVAQGEKSFVRMGAYVLIWPDEKYYNTQTGEFGSLGAEFTTYADVDVTASLCKLDGTPYEEYTVSAEAPANPENGQFWMDTSVTPNVLRYYSTTAAMWQSVPTVYTKIQSEEIGVLFQRNDGVEISGMTLEALNGSFYIVDKGADYIIVVALIPQTHTQTERVTIKRSIPKMDFVCENDNRIWGCSNEKHEIYGSVLGDPKNWNRFLGIASDSYAATVGTAGDFTGAISHAGSVLFFKENVLHQLMGTQPKNFTINDTMCRGVAKGSEKSLAHSNEYLLYKSPMDVCMMSGGSTMPASISKMLGREGGKNAVAGAIGSRYYMCVEMLGKKALLVFDTDSGAWCIEDDLDVTHFAQLDNELYMLTSRGEIWSVEGTAPENISQNSEREEVVEWELTTGALGLDEPYNKYVSGVQLHVWCELGTTIKVDVQYDGQGLWQRMLRIDPTESRSMVIPIAPRRCRTMKMRIYGAGAFELYSIAKTVEQGSDIYVSQ